MPSMQDLKIAGFNDTEIDGYMSQERITLQEAGFNDDEINTHFGVQPTQEDPRRYGLPKDAGEPISTITGKPVFETTTQPEVPAGHDIFAEDKQIEPKLGFMDKWREIKKEGVVPFVPFLSGAKEIKDIAGIAGIAHRLKNGEAIEPEEKDKLISFVQKANKDTDFWYKTLDVVSQMPAFMGEFYLTGGVYSAGRKVGTKVATSSIKRFMGKRGEAFLKKKAGKIGVKIVGGVAGATVQAPIMGVPRIISGTIERSMPKLKLTESERGDIDVLVVGEGEDLLPAFTKSLGDQWAETVSEHSGGLFGMLGNSVKNTAIKTGLFSAFMKANPKVPANKAVSFFKKIGYHGVVSEMLEERVGEGLRASLGLQEYKLPTVEQLGVELVSFSVPGVVQGLGARAFEKPTEEMPTEIPTTVPEATDDLTQLRDFYGSGKMAELLTSNEIAPDEILNVADQVQVDDADLAGNIRSLVKETSISKALAAKPGEERQEHLNIIIAAGTAQKAAEKAMEKVVKPAGLPQKAVEELPEPALTEPKTDVALEPVGAESPQQIAEQTGTTYIGEESGLHYWNVDVGKDAPTTITTKILDAKELQKKVLDTQKKFAEAEPVKAIPPGAETVTKPSERAALTKVEAGKEPWEMTSKEWTHEDLQPIIKQLKIGETKVLPDKKVIVRSSQDLTYGETYISREPVKTKILEPSEIDQLPDKIKKFVKRYKAGETKLPPIYVSELMVNPKTGEIFREIRDGHHRYYMAEKVGLEELPAMERISDLYPEDHEILVEQALKEGKPVPPEVLAEYPDLAPAKPQSKPIPTKTKPELPTEDFKGEGIGEVGAKEVTVGLKELQAIKNKKEGLGIANSDKYETQKEFLTRIIKEKGLKVKSTHDVHPADLTLQEYADNVNKNELEVWVNGTGFDNSPPRFSTPISLKKLHAEAKAEVAEKPVAKVEKEKVEVAPREPIKPTGTKKTIYLPDNTPIEISYDVIDSESLVVSHDTDLKINPAFPKELQPRDRGRKAMVLQVSEMAQKLNTERLGDSTGVGSGAPVVGKDGVVESGNGRIIAIRKAYKKDAGKAYKQWLISNAESFGLKPEQVKAIGTPILVRVRETDVDRVEFVKKANQDEVARMSPVETAKSDADRLTEGDIAIFTPSEEGDITAASNQSFISRFIKNLGTAESAGFLTEEGRYTKQLIDRITAAIFYKAYQSNDLITIMAEEADPNIKNILNALTVAAPEYVKIRALNKTLGDTAIIDHIVGAAQIISNTRNLGQSVEQFFKQMSMFEQVPEYTKEITLFIDKNKRSAKKQGEFFKRIAKRINDILVENNNIALPGMKHRDIDIGEIINDVIQQVEVKYEDKQRGLFAQDIERGYRGGEQAGYRRTRPGMAETGRGEISEAEGGVSYTKENIQTEFPEIISDRAGSYKSGVKTIVAPQDAAAFAHLNLSKYPQEHLATLILDKDHKIISVHRYSIGTPISAAATPSLISGHALNTPDAANIIIVHNHPSGDPKLSDADVEIFDGIKNVLEGTKVKAHDIIAIGENAYSSYLEGWETAQPIPKVVAQYEVPMVERVFKARGKNLHTVKDSGGVVLFAEDNLPEGGLIFINSANNIVGTLPIKDYSRLRGVTSENILKQVDATNAISIIAYSPDVDIPATDKTNLRKFANATALKLFDIVDKKGSWADLGLMPVATDTVFYATKETKGQKNLLVVHNLSIANLRHSIKMGGIAVPSTAVIDVEKSSFDSFGEITLIASKDKLGPGVSKSNKYFNADVYSPRYPQVTYFLTDKGRKAFDSYIEPIWDSIPKAKDNQNGISSNYVLKERIKEKGPLVVFQEGDPLLHYAYLKEIGKLPKGIDTSWESKTALRESVEEIGRDKFESWAADKVKELKIEADEKIFNGFTYAGNRKYLKHDLDTVVRLLKKELKDGEGFNYGVPSIRAKNAIQFRTVKQIQASRDKIVSSEDMQKLKDETDAEFMRLSDNAIPHLKYKRGFGDLDSFSEHIKEAIDTHNFTKIFGDNSEYYEPGVDVKGIVDFVNKLRNMPTEYFEGKIQRAVGITEFEKAVVPDNTPKDIITWLEKNGIKVDTYKKGDAVDRKSKIKISATPDLLFATKQSISDSDITISQVRDLFKPLHSGLTQDGNIWVKLRGGYGFQVKNVQSIAENKLAFEIGRGRMRLNGELIAGKFEDDTIEIVKGIGDKFTLSHESEHLAEKAGLITPGEITALKRKITWLVRAGKFETSNKKDIGGQEDRAKFIETELHKRASYTGTTQKILNKIADFIDSLVNLFHVTSRGVTRAFESGKIFQREVAGREVQTTVPAFAKTAERFYSQVIKTVETKMPDKMSASDVMNWLKKQPGIKEAELEWLGIEDMLEGKKVVTRDELTQLLRQNEVRVKEVVKGDKQDVGKIENARDKIQHLIAKYDTGLANEIDAQFNISDIRKYDSSISGFQDEYFGGDEDTEGGYTGKLSKEDSDKLDQLQKIVYEGSGRGYGGGVQPSFAQWQLPGKKENYRELLFTLPTAVSERKRLAALDSERPLTPEEQTRYDELQKQTENEQFFKSSHWDEPNVFAHVRINERTDADGNRILFVEEVQSDQALAGRKRGYKTQADENRLAEIKERLKKIQIKNRVAPGNIEGLAKLQSENAEFAELSKEGTEIEKRRYGSVPDFPFKTNYHEYVMKRIVRMAAEQGFSKLAWVTGQQTADRYDLSKQVKHVAWEKNENETYNINAPLPNGNPGIYEEDLSLSEVERLIGKDITKRIAEGKGNKDTTSPYRDWFILEGEDLKVGGEWALNLYDKMIPQYLKKFGKKYGSEVGETTFVTEEEYKDSKNLDIEMAKEMGEAFTAHSFTITPELKRMALYEGMPMFAMAGKKAIGAPTGALAKAQEGYKELLRRYQEQHTTPLVEDLISKAKTDTLDPVKNSPDEVKAFIKDVRDALKNVSGSKRFSSEVISIKDMEWYHRALETPYVLAKKFTSMANAMKTEIKRHESRSKKLFKYYHGELGDLQKHMQGNKADLKAYEGLIWEWEGRRMPEKEVPTDWYSISEDGDLQVNPQHYVEVRSYLKKQGANDAVADAFITTRKILDDVLVEADLLMRDSNVDESDLQEFRASIGKTHNYFSHSRDGDAYIRIKNNNTGKVVYREHFYKIKERMLPENKMAKARAAAWLNEQVASGKLRGTAEDYNISPARELTEFPDEIFFQIPVEALSQISMEAGRGLVASRTHYEAQRLMKKEGLSEKEAHDKAYKILTADMERHLAKAIADVLKTRGWGAHAIQRQNIPGFKKTDTFDTLFQYLSGYSGFVTKIQATREHSKTLQAMDAKRTPNEYRYTSGYIRDMLANSDQTDRMVDRLRGMFFVKYLGGVIKSGVVNLTQNVVMAGPILSQYTKGSHIKLARAMKDVRKAVVGKNAWIGEETEYTTLPGNEQRALTEMVETGAAQDLFLRELKGEIPGTGWGKYVKKVINKSGIFMQVAEKFNRASTGLAAYRIAFDGGITYDGKQTKGDHDLSVEFAKGVIYDSHFLYGKPNLPAAFRGGDFRKMARATYTFRSFTHNYLDIMADLVANQGTQGLKVAGRSMMNIMVLGGLTSIPFFNALSGIIMSAMGDDDDDALTKIRDKMPNKFMQDMVVYGLIGAAGGVDLSGSLSIEVPRNFKDIIGVPYAVYEDSMNMVKSIKAGNQYRAVSETPFTPIAVRNAMRGIELYTKGQRARSGKAINAPGAKGPRKISGIEAIKKSVFGFQPTEVSSGYKAYSATQKMKAEIQDKKRSLADRMANAKIDLNFKEVANIRREVREWNIDARKEKKLWRVIDINDMVKSRLQGNKIKGIPKSMRGEAKKRYATWQ